MNSNNSDRKLYGLLAEVRNPKELLNIAEAVNKSGFNEYDTYSPFPVHGIDRAMSLKKSRLGWIVLVCGLIGLTGALSMIFFMQVVDYPLNISGKTLLNIPAWIPVTFELTVLLSAFGTVFGMFALNGLPRFNHRLSNGATLPLAQHAGFLSGVGAVDRRFDLKQVSS